MKKYIFAFILSLVSLFVSIPAFAAAVITAPIDSRPISNSYLESLVSLNNDTFYTVDSRYLDIFTQDTEKFADSAKVRETVRQNVKANNSEDTTVIINASSYFTGGLIGSRCAEQYNDTDKALKELLSLVSDYPKPKYYVNIAMPRNLPESRGQEIWPDENKIKGLSSFYLEFNPDCEDREKVESAYSMVTPSQFLMEYGYVYNKKTEKGVSSLTQWEKAFIEYCDKNYVNAPVYSKYIENYIKPFESTAKICESLIRWQKAGKIDEIIIGNDDLQLPASVSYFFNTGADWIPLENGSPVKYSFSRTYMSVGNNSIQKRMEHTLSAEETKKALTGQAKGINFIFGMDEIPQLIYARSLSERYGFSPSIDVVNYKNNTTAADYDVLSSGKLSENALNFISAGLEPVGDKTTMLIFDYSVCSDNDKADFMELISKSLQENETGLIELYDYNTIKNANNFIFRQLLDNSAEKNGSVGIADLSAFSAWNTNANAIGIGLANAAVYSTAKTNCSDIVSFAQKQAQILCQHILDDGLYYGGIREALSAQGYSPSPSEMTQSQKLYELLDTKKVIDAFSKKRFIINSQAAYITYITVEKTAFPWQRLFDCEIKVKCGANKLTIPGRTN